MTPELTYLAWAALLTTVLWIPYIAGQVMTNGFLSAENYKDPTPGAVPLWAQRANRTHINSVETLGPFAALILIIHVSGQANDNTALWAAVFFWARVVHAGVYWLGIPYVRTLSFAAGNVATLVLFYEAIT